MWLELHDSGGALHVNMDNVICFRRYDGTDMTEVVTHAINRDSLMTYHVIETPDHIENMIVEEQRRLADLTKTAR